jgi:outer membrane protein OmpA-like peptidoglycan-associated protein
MAITDLLFSGVQSFITPDFISKASGLVKESPEGIRSGLKGVIPTVLMGLVNRGSTKEGAGSLLQMVQDDGYDSGVPSNYLSHFSAGEASERYARKGQDALSMMFGSQLGNITNRLAGNSGISSGSVSKLMGLVAPIVMGVLGSKVKKQGWDATSLSSYLGGQRSSLKTMMAPGLEDLFEGRGKTDEQFARDQLVQKQKVTALPERRQSYSTEEEAASYGTPERKKRGFGLPMALAALLLVGAFFWMKNRHGPEVVTTTQQTEQAGRVGGKVSPPAESMRQSEEKQTGYGATTAPGREIQNVLSSPTAELPKRIPLNEVKFSQGKANLSPEAEGTLKDVAQTLKANPRAQVQVEGFADRQGDPAQSSKLSLDRARSVQQELTENGVKPDQLKVVGQGAAQPAVPRPQTQGGQEDRRVDLIVTQR